MRMITVSGTMRRECIRDAADVVDQLRRQVGRETGYHDPRRRLRDRPGDVLQTHRIRIDLSDIAPSDTALLPSATFSRIGTVTRKLWKKTHHHVRRAVTKNLTFSR